MKQILKLLCVSAAVFILAACGGEQSEVIPEFDLINGTPTNLDGYVFNYLVCVEDWNESASFGYVDDTLFGEKARQRQNDVEEKLNCIIEPVYKTKNDASTYVTTAMFTGDSSYDAVQGQDTLMNGSMRIGGLLPISLFSDIIDVKDTDKWGEPCFLEGIAWEDDLYGVIPASWPELTTSYCGYPIAFNADLAATFANGDPRQYLEDKTWSRDVFNNLIELYTYNDGEKEIKGLSAHNYHFAEMAVYCSTPAMAYKSTKTESGWESTLYGNEAYKAFEWIRDIFHGKYKNNVINAAGYVAASEDMLNGNCVMSMSYLGYFFSTGSTIANVMGEIGLMPFPLGDNMPWGEWMSCVDWVNYVIAFPISAQNPDYAAIVLNEVYEPLDGLETQEQLDAFFTNYIFYNSSDYEVYKKLSENTRYTFFSEGLRHIIEAVTASNNEALSSLLSARAEKEQELIDKYIAPSYNAIEAVYGVEYEYNK